MKDNAKENKAKRVYSLKIQLKILSYFKILRKNSKLIQANILINKKEKERKIQTHVFNILKIAVKEKYEIIFLHYKISLIKTTFKKIYWETVLKMKKNIKISDKFHNYLLKRKVFQILNKRLQQKQEKKNLNEKLKHFSDFKNKILQRKIFRKIHIFKKLEFFRKMRKWNHILEIFHQWKIYIKLKSLKV